MARFTDGEGREWDIRIVTPHLAKLRGVGLDLNAAIKRPDAWDALDDPETLVRVAWVLCEKAAAAAGVTPDQFAEGFDGPARYAALAAVFAATADFYQPPAVAEQTKRDLPAAMSGTTAPSGSNGTATPSPPSPGPTPPG